MSSSYGVSNGWVKTRLDHDEFWHTYGCLVTCLNAIRVDLADTDYVGVDELAAGRSASIECTRRGKERKTDLETKVLIDVLVPGLGCGEVAGTRGGTLEAFSEEHRGVT